MRARAKLPGEILLDLQHSKMVKEKYSLTVYVIAFETEKIIFYIAIINDVSICLQNGNSKIKS